MLRLLLAIVAAFLISFPQLAFAIDSPNQKSEASAERLPVQEAVTHAVDLLVAEAKFNNNLVARQLIGYVNELDTLTVNYSLDEADQYDIRIDREGSENQIWLRPEYVTYNPYVVTTLLAYGITQLHGLYSTASQRNCIDSVVHAYEMQARLWASYHNGPKPNPEGRIEIIFNQSLEMARKGELRAMVVSDPAFLSFCNPKKM